MSQITHTHTHTHISESCHARQESCYRFQFFVTHWNVYHDSFKCVPWLIGMCTMTHSYMYYDSFMCVKRLLQNPFFTFQFAWLIQYMYHDSFIYVPWLIHACTIIHSYITMTRSYMCHDSFMRLKQLLQKHFWTFQFAWPNKKKRPLSKSFHAHEINHGTCMSESRYIYEWVTVRIWMSPVTCFGHYALCHTFEWVMSHVRMSRVTRSNESCLQY